MSIRSHHNSSVNSLTYSLQAHQNTEDNAHSHLWKGHEKEKQRKTTHLIIFNFLGVEHLAEARLRPLEQASHIVFAVQVSREARKT